MKLPSGISVAGCARPVRRDYRHLPDRFQRLLQRKQPLGVHAVIVGNNNSHLDVLHALRSDRTRMTLTLGTLATIGSTSPFIGLFGTVLAVMAAFQDDTSCHG